MSNGLSLKPLLRGTGKTSARNVLRGTASRATQGTIDAEVTLSLARDVEIVATITRGSAEDLGLLPGATALALIKASHVILAVE